MPAARWGLRAFGNPRFLAAAAILVAVLSVLPFIRYLLNPLPLLDLYAHIDGAHDWQHGLDPYRIYLSHKPGEIGGGYVFPPFTLPFFLAVGYLPRPIAAGLWTIAGLAALAWLVWDLAAPRTSLRLAALTVLAVWYSPLLANFALGQVGVFVLAGVWAAGRLASKAGERRAGIALGLASLFKLFPLISGASMLVRGRWRTLAWSFLVVVAAVVATWPLVGNLWPEYVQGVLIGHVGSTSTSPGNQSIAAALTRSLTANSYQRPLVDWPALAGALSLILPLVLFALVLWRIQRQSNDRVQDALVLACLPLVIPNAWQHYYVLALPLLWFVLSAGVEHRNPWLLGAGAIALVTLSWLASTIDEWYFRVAHIAPVWHGLYANASVLGGLVLVLAGSLLARRSGVDTRGA